MADDAPTLTPEQREHYEALFKAMAQVAEHRDWLISDEMRQRLPEYEEREDAAAARVAELWAALKPAETELGRLNDEIARAEGEMGQWQDKLSSAAGMGERVTARAWVSEWDEETGSLNQKKDLLLRELGPVREMYLKAKDAMQDATAQREAFELNLTIPLFGMGQQTKAFRAWFLEMGTFAQVLLGGNRDSFLWDAAWEFMDTVALRSGYRTSHLPTDAENVRRSFENYMAERQNAANVPGAPSMTEVMHLDALRMQEALAPKEHVEDYRRPGLRIPVGRG